jgi:two-component system cell cycle response regulator
VNSTSRDGSIKILIVEDDAVCARAMAVVLRQQGHAVVTASDGVQAMRMARLERPDLIMLDIGLPGGDGFTTLARLRNLSETAATPVVMASSRPAAAVAGRAKQLGADEFLAKPIASDALLETVVRLTRAR